MPFFSLLTFDMPIAVYTLPSVGDLASSVQALLLSELLICPHYVPPVCQPLRVGLLHPIVHGQLQMTQSTRRQSFRWGRVAYLPVLAFS